MLTQLYIENVAVISKAAIRLTQGLNVFTGETGAGKTILISAIDAVLGERTSREIIRTGEERAVVSALFEELSAQALEKLCALGYTDDEGAVLITREITSAGKSVCKINGQPATTSVLREIASLLIHIHGQRDSQQLLLPERHVELVDAFGELATDVAGYNLAYDRMRSLRTELSELHLDDAEKARRIDLLTYQIDEIEAAGLDDEEEEDQLTARRKVIRNSERIAQSLSSAYGALSGGEDWQGIDALFDELAGGVEGAARFVPQFEGMSARLLEMRYELTDFAEEISACLEELEFDPKEQSDIEYRLDTIYKLKRKYGESIAEIQAFCDKARRELEDITTADVRRDALTLQLEAARVEAQTLADALSTKRRKAAKDFMSGVEAQFAHLDMPAAKLSVEHKTRALVKDGADELAFLIVTNVGELPKPLSKIASGGEIARIMLAIKNVLAERDQIATLIFDEVDTGVSGRAAQKIGRKLRQVSRTRQVIAVTHLAQVAAFANSHLYICKEVEDGRTFTRVTELSQEEKIRELARIVSGDLITDLALENAAEFWRYSQNEAEASDQAAQTQK